MNLLLLTGLLSSGTVRGALVREPATGQSFAGTTGIDGRPYVLLGTGVRKLLGLKIYAMALYVDEAEARRAFPSLVARAGGSDHDHLTRGELAQSFVLSGTFGKRGVLHFVRDVGANRIRAAFADRMEDVLGERATPDMRRMAEQFLSILQQDMKRGQEIVVQTRVDGTIDVEVAGEKKPTLTSPQLAQAIWAVWLGRKPISADLRKSLVEGIDVLAAQ